MSLLMGACCCVSASDPCVTACNELPSTITYWYTGGHFTQGYHLFGDGVGDPLRLAELMDISYISQPIPLQTAAPPTCEYRDPPDSPYYDLDTNDALVASGTFVNVPFTNTGPAHPCNEGATDSTDPYDPNRVQPYVSGLLCYSSCSVYTAFRSFVCWPDWSASGPHMELGFGFSTCCHGTTCKCEDNGGSLKGCEPWQFWWFRPLLDGDLPPIGTGNPWNHSNVTVLAEPGGTTMSGNNPFAGLEVHAGGAHEPLTIVSEGQVVIL